MSTPDKLMGESCLDRGWSVRFNRRPCFDTQLLWYAKAEIWGSIKFRTSYILRECLCSIKLHKIGNQSIGKVRAEKYNKN